MFKRNKFFIVLEVLQFPRSQGDLFQINCKTKQYVLKCFIICVYSTGNCYKIRLTGFGSMLNRNINLNRGTSGFESKTVFFNHELTNY
jgi:hypothetical protein